MEHEILPKESSIKIKNDRITITLKKEKKNDTWNNLVSKGPKVETGGENADPGASLNNMMKKMYDEGDDTMKRTIGEAMLKSREKKDGKMDSMGM